MLSDIELAGERQLQAQTAAFKMAYARLGLLDEDRNGNLIGWFKADAFIADKLGEPVNDNQRTIVSVWRRGERLIPSPKQAAVCAALGITLFELFGAVSAA